MRLHVTLSHLCSREARVMKSILIQMALLLGAMPAALAGDFVGPDQDDALSLAAGGIKRLTSASKTSTVSATDGQRIVYVERRCDEPLEFTLPGRYDYSAHLGERCYYDSDGRLHHWAWFFTEKVGHGNDFWGKKRPITETEVFVTGYSTIRERQRAYNAWIKSSRDPGPINREAIKPCSLLRLDDDTEQWRLDDYHFRSESIPRRIPEDGRLTVQMFNLPNIYAKCHSAGLARGLMADCRAAGGSRDDCEGTGRRVYPNIGLELRDKALGELRDSIQNLFNMVKNLDTQTDYFADPKRRSYGFNDLIPERLPPHLIEEFRLAGDDLTAKIENAQMLQDAYRSQYEPSN